jgi:antitoxin (DNA-binding transcriptional repressor) of toxin-antitoxin stability system
MNRQNTISIQEVRKNPLAFLRQINEGKTMVVIYHSKPFATVTSAETITPQELKSTKRMLEYAKLARDSAHNPINSGKNYKELYAEDMAKKYGIS